ncbi:PP2C family protein-serine/threonine phosphatase [Streptomyces humi]|uniref:PP2C family protein-serine/threonine phosphatase n=1 Tax=Streptomyces humi TaxID=1428620 RepID=UPI0006288130|nr:PP2C family protein-serine/threonine phosphatase [Streptomyces humi]
MGLLIPVVLVALITVADTVTPADIVLGPLLVIAPALAAWFEGPWATGGVGVLAVAAQTLIGWRSGLLTSRGVIVQLVALTVLTGLIVVMCAVRDRRGRQLAQVRSVAGAAQRVLLWPLPNRLGGLRLASVYLAAEDEAQIGGDLYAAARTGNAVRLLIGDVRGKGLPAIGEAAVVLGAFREAAHQHAGLPELAAALDRSVARYLVDFEPEHEAGERFVTVLLLEVPDDEPAVRLTSCGHLAPLLLAADGSVTVPHLHPAPPLGIALTDAEDHPLDTLSFATEDTLLLYTDGVIEARDRDGTFYPLADRAAQWAGSDPDALLQHVRRDLIAHTGGRLGDDVALIGVRRAAAPHARHRQGRSTAPGELCGDSGTDPAR